MLWGLALYGLLVLGVLFVWWMQTDQSQYPWRLPVAAVLCLTSGLWALAWMLRVFLPAGHIAWDTHAWSINNASLANVSLNGVPQVCADGQRWLLLRVTPLGLPARWLWVERNASPAQWMALRRALYSRPKPNPVTMDALQHSGASAPSP